MILKWMKSCTPGSSTRKACTCPFQYSRGTDHLIPVYIPTVKVPTFEDIGILVYENKDADQFRGKREADQLFVFVT